MAEAEFTDDSPIVDADTRRVYIEQLLTVSAHEAKNITLLSTVAVATAAFAAKEAAPALSHQELVFKIGGLGGVLFLLAGAGTLFAYVATINSLRMYIARRIFFTDAFGARQLWRERKRTLFLAGMALLVVGAVVGTLTAGILFLK